MQSLAIPALEPDIGLSVPADTLCIPAAACVMGAGPSRSIAALRHGAQILLARLASVHPRCDVVARRLQLGSGSFDKTAKLDRSDVQLDAVVRVPLERDVDLWARAELAAQTVEGLSAVAADLAKHKPAVKLGWRNPVARVLDVDPYRDKLIGLWNDRVRAMLGGLDGVHLSGAWEAPVEVLQTPISLEQVRLTLGRGTATRDRRE